MRRRANYGNGCCRGFTPRFPHPRAIYRPTAEVYFGELRLSFLNIHHNYITSFYKNQYIISLKIYVKIDKIHAFQLLTIAIFYGIIL